MSDDTTTAEPAGGEVSAEQCAQLLLDTVPPLMRTIGALRRRAGGEEGPGGLNFGQIRMLSMLRHHEWTLGDLAERHQVAASTMSRSVDVLVKRGWVERRPGEHDRRQVVLVLTPAGMAAHEEIGAETRALVAELIGRLREADRARLAEGLGALRALLEDATGCLRDQEPRP